MPTKQINKDTEVQPFIVLVMALPSENHEDLLTPLVHEVMYTGVGKVNAAVSITSYILEYWTRQLRDPLLSKMPLHLINVGSAGSHKLNKGEVVVCPFFIQADMDATPLGFQRGQTPFEDYIVLANNQGAGHPLSIPLYMGMNPKGPVCHTVDAFVTEKSPHFEMDVIDMEAYALAKACMMLKVPFSCLKYISDGANESASSDWLEIVTESAKNLYEPLKKLIERIQEEAKKTMSNQGDQNKTGVSDSVRNTEFDELMQRYNCDSLSELIRLQHYEIIQLKTNAASPPPTLFENDKPETMLDKAVWVMTRVKESVQRLKVENQHLRQLLVNMTHHEGAVEETRSQWEEIVKKTLSENWAAYKLQRQDEPVALWGIKTMQSEGATPTEVEAGRRSHLMKQLAGTAIGSLPNPIEFPDQRDLEGKLHATHCKHYSKEDRDESRPLLLHYALISQNWKLQGIFNPSGYNSLLTGAQLTNGDMIGELQEQAYEEMQSLLYADHEVKQVFNEGGFQWYSRLLPMPPKY